MPDSFCLLKRHFYVIMYVESENNNNGVFVAGGKRRTKEEVIAFLESIGYTYVSGYTGRVSDRMNIICDKGHSWQSDYSNLRKDGRCVSCYRAKRKLGFYVKTTVTEINEVLHKMCSTCKETKPFADFIKAAGSNKYGVTCTCKSCKAVYTKQWLLKNRDRQELAGHKCKLKKYNLTLEEYDKMSNKQGDVCMICGGVNSRKNGKIARLYVDHCHDTNKVRGLLCLHCNSVLGYAKDNVKTLETCIAYLKLHRGDNNDNQKD